MIQRIQSVYLLLIIVCSSVLFFIPVVQFQAANISFSIVQYIPALAINTSNVPSLIWLTCVNCIIILLTGLTLFLFKNRPLQNKLCRFLFLANTIFIVFIFFIAGELEKITQIKANYSVGAYVPFLTFLLLVLTIRAIKKDELLVKSADRLRS